MIKMVLEKRSHRGGPDISCPKFYCDYCERPIEDAGQGMYLWDGAPENEAYFAGEPVDLYTVHKGRCTRGLCVRMGWDRDDPPTIELSCLPVYLAANMGIVSDKDWSRAKWMAAAGPR